MRIKTMEDDPASSKLTRRKIPSEWVSTHVTSSTGSELVTRTESPTDSDILELLEPQKSTCLLRVGRCWRGDPLTNTGKRQQILQILSLTLLPILGLWAFTVYSVSESIKGKTDLEQAQSAVQFSVEIGRFLDRIQRERDMSVLYLSILGPETKTFLMNEYLLTDEAVEKLSHWPVNDEFGDFFQSKEAFQEHLDAHRDELDPINFDIYVEMNFYNLLIERFVVWMYGAITESSMASIWKVLVAYQKIVTGMEHIGIERALGTVFYVDGKLSQQLYERYIARVNIFKANYRSAVLYSEIVDPIFQEGVTRHGTNLTLVIERFRFEIQHSILEEASIIKGQWWFDNMTMYLDRLLTIQQDLATLINGELQIIIDLEEKNLTISVCFLALVILMCPLVIYSVETLTSGIQLYAIAMVKKTKELVKERRRADNYLYLMVPGPIASKIKRCKSVDAEYFKSVTILFCDFHDISDFINVSPKHEAIDTLNEIFNEIDEILSNYNVFKVETVRDSYMVAAGLPDSDDLHPQIMANVALSLIGMMKKKCPENSKKVQLKLRIGVHTGPCTAGTVNAVIPRYCLFGHTVSIASRLKRTSRPNCILIGHSTQRFLKEDGSFKMKYRSVITIRLDDKNNTAMRTYWLTGRANKDGEDDSEDVIGENDALDDSSAGSQISTRAPEESTQEGQDVDISMYCESNVDRNAAILPKKSNDYDM